jgi:threonine/homoserine/homoserine lactone efflux protein
MMSLNSYFLFVAASVALILVPGPAQALVIATTLDRGPKQGVLTAVGLNVGTLFHAAAAGLGLSAILATSALAFSIVKYIGAAYLLYLGIKALRSRPSAEVSTGGGTFGQAVLTGILNPKVALFFLAFLPQFVDPTRGAVMFQFLLLGLTMAVLDTLYEGALVSVSHRLRGRLAKSRRLETLRNRISGAVLVLLSVRLALQER